MCIFLITFKKPHLLRLPKHTKILICKENNLYIYLCMDSRDNLESRTHKKKNKKWKRAERIDVNEQRFLEPKGTLMVKNKNKGLPWWLSG